MKAAKKRYYFDQQDVNAMILRDAQALGISLTTAKVIADHVSQKASAWVQKRSVITEDDLNRFLAQELKKYNDDLSYVYQNRGKIV